MAPMGLLVSVATAAEPDLSGVHVALGVGIHTALAPPETTVSSPAESAVRLHMGPRWIVEVAGYGTLNSESDLSHGEVAQGDAAAIDHHDETDLAGWTAGGGGRLRYRLNADGPNGVNVGVGLAGEYGEAEGPWYEEVVDEDSGDVTVEEVGRRTEARREWSADVSAAWIHWVTERLAVTGEIAIPFYSSEEILQTDVRTDGDADVTDDDDRSIETSLGFPPRIGLSLHLLL